MVLSGPQLNSMTACHSCQSLKIHVLYKYFQEKQLNSKVSSISISCRHPVLRTYCCHRMPTMELYIRQTCCPANGRVLPLYVVLSTVGLPALRLDCHQRLSLSDNMYPQFSNLHRINHYTLRRCGPEKTWELPFKQQEKKFWQNLRRKSIHQMAEQLQTSNAHCTSTARRPVMGTYSFGKNCGVSYPVKYNQSLINQSSVLGVD